MNLFRKLLFNIFPSNFHVWPNGKMFVSLVSAKDFFSLVIKKSIENYKVNNFDIAIDPFDIKIWIWEEVNIKPKDVDFYYSYASAAHYNGYRFFTVSNLATNIAMIAWHQNRDIFQKSEYSTYVNYILSVYLLCYVFGSGIKSFPKFEYKDNEDLQNQQYKWFLDVFFGFWDMIMSESKIKIKPERFAQIKKEMTMNLQMFFAIFYTVRMLNEWLITDNEEENQEYFEWLLTQKSTVNIDSVSSFIENYKDYIYSDLFDNVQQKIAISLIAPYDIHIKYFYNQENAFAVNDFLIDKIFDSNKINWFLESFLVNDSELENFCIYISDINNIKNTFFTGVNNYISHNAKEVKWSVEDMVEEWKDDESFLAPENMISKLEQTMKNEMMTTQWIIDFYIKYVWSLWIGRWDNFFVKRFRKPLIDQVYNYISNNWENQLDLYNAKVNNIYIKNNFYYDSFFDSLRYKKWNIKIPLMIDWDYEEPALDLDIIYKSAICAIFQDISIRDSKIYTSNKKIIKRFQDDFADHITILVNSQPHRLISYIYGPTISLISKSPNVDLWENAIALDKIIQNNINIADISRLKDSLYLLDIHIWRDFVWSLWEKTKIYEKYDWLQLANISATLRENIFWLLLLVKYLQSRQEKEKIDLMISRLLDIYIGEVLFIDWADEIHSIVYETLARYDYYLDLWIWMDENTQYLKIFLDTWSAHLYNLYNDLDASIWYEDIIWLKWYLRNISYYNKRVLIWV